jgi:tetratricopeptide (TPR) repeat protein
MRRRVLPHVLMILGLGSALVPGGYPATVRAPWSDPAFVSQQSQGQRKPNIEAQDENTADPKTAPKATSSRSTKTRKVRETRRELPSDYAVVLATNAPEADIQVDGDNVGKAGKDGKLPTRIKPGRHTVTVTHAKFRSLTRPIDIGPGLTEINFHLEEVSAPIARDSTPPALPEPPAKPAPSADSIMKKFTESQRPDAVTIDEWKEVQTQSEKALSTDPNNAQLKARMLFAHGQRDYLRGEYTLALVAFNESIQTSSDFGLAYYGAGNCYMATNVVLEAEKAYLRSVQVAPAFAPSHKALGDALSKLGNRKDANEEYVKARQLGYKDPDLSLGIARNLMADQRWGAALQELKPLADRNPSAETFVAIGECYEALKTELSAALAFSRATDLDRNSAAAYYRLGVILLNHREYAPAKEALERAIAADPQGLKIKLGDATERLKEASGKAHK